MEKMGIQDDEPIQHRWITSSIENAQKRVEGQNFNMRKNLLEYDDVLNQQRKIVYEGWTDEGWKDTILVMPGETVKLAMKFERYKGLYLYHCHNLEHESSGMMRNFRVA